jgi:hypothetical protein
MTAMRSVIRTIALIACISIPLFSQGNPSVVLKGAVVGEDGAGIKAVFVLVRDFDASNQEYVSNKWETRTGADGTFSFVIQSGCYDIFVSANELFFPFAKRICIRSQPTSLKVKLKANPHPVLRQQ